MPENDNYEVLEKIGHGSFGVIRKVRRKVDGMIVCRKEISYLKMSQKEREQLHAEFQILSTLRHENIVGYFHREHLKTTQDLYLYMEYCGNGDLGRVIRDLQQRNQYAEEAFVWSIFSQLVTALYRCHYGVNPPEVGKNFLGLGATAKPETPAGGMTILHRDLKPENVFLGESNLVKLGDFGLAKMIQSHDFASTYVGTPFYMSPEICAAEKYTLKSDIWSLGCIIYELCTREPPFNAKTHFQLVQKIKEGRIAPLPSIYSPELMAVIKDCLRVNPDRRPDTAALLNLPVVRLMRKEKEVVDMSKLLKVKEDALSTRAQDYERKVEAARREMDAALHREWEVKARLEIDRVVKEELAKLQKTFEQEVQARVETELLRRHQQERERERERERQQQQQQQQQRRQAAVSFDTEESEDSNELSSSLSKNADYPRSSLGTGSTADGDFPSTTDITELSINSPDTSGLSNNSGHSNRSNRSNTQQQQLLRKATTTTASTARTPFGRAQTMFAGPGAVGTPMDVEMASPSPIAIASLSLSPRRNPATRAPNAHQGNIFAIPSAIADDPRWAAPRGSSGSDGFDDGVEDEGEDDDDDQVIIPSPTRMIRSSKNNPFGGGNKAGGGGGAGGGGLLSKVGAAARPGLTHQKSAPINRLRPQPSLPAPAKTATGCGGGAEGLRTAGSSGALRERCASPNRRLSKIPSAANLNGAANVGSGNNNSGGDGLPTISRKPSLTRKDLKGCGVNGNSGTSNGNANAVNSNNNNNNNIRGRTLVELQQARAGGRPLSAVLGGTENSGNVMNLTLNLSPKRAFKEHVVAMGAGGNINNNNGRPCSAASAPLLEPAAVWDPERDEMPSPFLVRRKPIGRV